MALIVILRFQKLSLQELEFVFKQDIKPEYLRKIAWDRMFEKVNM